MILHISIVKKFILEFCNLAPVMSNSNTASPGLVISPPLSLRTKSHVSPYYMTPDSPDVFSDQPFSFHDYTCELL